MEDAWKYVGKVGAALLIGLLAVVAFLPEKRAQVLLYLDPIQDLFRARKNTLQASALESTEESIVEEKKALPNERTLISAHKNLNYEKSCSIQFNKEKPNEATTYTDKENDLSIQVQFNKSWGNNYFSINPFEKTIKEGIAFGPLVKNNTCEWVRPFILEVEKGMADKNDKQECLQKITQNSFKEKKVVLYSRCDIELEEKQEYYSKTIESLRNLNT